jgi:RES domain-containing protein
MDGHKIYDSNFPALSTNPSAQYRFSDPSYRSTGGDVYFGENVVTSYMEERKNINGKSLFVGDFRVDNILDLTDPNVLKQMNIDPARLTARVDNPVQQKAVYGYTNKVSNQAYDAGYNGILYPSSRKSGNNQAIILFDGRYDSDAIKLILDRQIKP